MFEDTCVFRKALSLLKQILTECQVNYEILELNAYRNTRCWRNNGAFAKHGNRTLISGHLIKQTDDNSF